MATAPLVMRFLLEGLREQKVVFHGLNYVAHLRYFAASDNVSKLPNVTLVGINA